MEGEPGETVRVVPYVSETQLAAISALVDRTLSEPYSVYTYRYFLHGWPNLCFLASLSQTLVSQTPLKSGSAHGHEEEDQTSQKSARQERTVGLIVGRLEPHDNSAKSPVRRGYIAMLVVDEALRGCGVGEQLVSTLVAALREQQCDEVVLETESSNEAALLLYERAGFVREKRLARYYYVGTDAFRLRLDLRL